MRPTCLAFGFATALLCLHCKSKSSQPEPPVESIAERQPAAHAVASAKPTSDEATTTNAPAPPLNVMLLTIDSLRADMPWTTYERDIAPNLTALAKQSVVYRNAYSVSSSTSKSAPAILVGRYPSSIYRDGWFFAGFSPANLFFTEVLQERSVRTLGGHAHMYFDRGKNLDQGFDVWRVVDGIGFDSKTDRHVTSDKMTDMAIQMLSDSANTQGQFFLWFHYMDPHDQYIKHEASPDFGDHNRDRYDSEVYFTDLHVGRLFDFAKQQPWWDRTVVIISADHGEAFGDHGMHKHGFELWEVLTHVPLLFHGPTLQPREIDARRSHIDLAPTILELMGVSELPEGLQGKSMVPELRGAEPDNREPILLDLPEDYNSADRKALIWDDYKLIVQNFGARYRLYNLAKDPKEEHDLAKREPEKLKELKERFEKAWSELEPIQPYGGMKLASGRTARGPQGPAAPNKKERKPKDAKTSAADERKPKDTKTGAADKR